MKDTHSINCSLVPRSLVPHSVAERVVVVAAQGAPSGRVHAAAAINVGPANTTLNTTLKNAALDAAAVLNAVKKS